MNQEKQRNVALEWAEALVVSVLTVAIVFIFFFRVVGVSGTSMLPTLEHGDKLLISKLFYTPAYGDIIVLTKESYMQEPLVKRIIATEGQEVYIDFETGDVFVDNVLLHENYINEKTYLQADVTFPQVVPEDHVFVLGDNRNASSDSRVAGIGMVHEDLILGKVILRILPFDKLGMVK